MKLIDYKFKSRKDMLDFMVSFLIAIEKNPEYLRYRSKKIKEMTDYQLHMFLVQLTAGEDEIVTYLINRLKWRKTLDGRKSRKKGKNKNQRTGVNLFNDGKGKGKKKGGFTYDY